MISLGLVIYQFCLACYFLNEKTLFTFFAWKNAHYLAVARAVVAKLTRVRHNMPSPRASSWCGVESTFTISSITSRTAFTIIILRVQELSSYYLIPFQEIQGSVFKETSFKECEFWTHQSFHICEHLDICFSLVHYSKTFFFVSSVYFAIRFMWILQN